jgi:uncharacterized protein YcsI (UPF0317 family)
MTPSEVREKVRSGDFTAPTSGLCEEYIQANLVILPKDLAFDFLLFCQRNPKSCPLIDVTDAGSYIPKMSAPQADLRTDLPKYRIYRDVSRRRTYGYSSVLTDDMVGFNRLQLHSKMH